MTRPLTFDCDFDLECGNQCFVHGIPSHDALSFCEVYEFALVLF